MDKPRGAAGAIAEDDLHALVDGRLAPEAAAALRRRLAADPAAQALADAWQAQRAALRALHAPVEALELPASLLAAADRAASAHARTAQWWRWGGMAASVVLAFGMGWVASGHWRGGVDATVAAGSPAHRFAEQAAVAHVVFQPEVRHPVEVPAAQQQHLVQWLSKRLGRPLKVPVLSAQGYELLGGRLLPGDDGVRAQFMYQNAAGERMTLYVGAIKAAHSAAAGETAFRFLDDGPVPGFYWVDQGFGYAIAGKLSRPALQELATAVYRQL
jgi:anti-sigma factor RsiW